MNIEKILKLSPNEFKKLVLELKQADREIIWLYLNLCSQVSLRTLKNRTQTLAIPTYEELLTEDTLVSQVIADFNLKPSNCEPDFLGNIYKSIFKSKVKRGHRARNKWRQNHFYGVR